MLPGKDALAFAKDTRLTTFVSAYFTPQQNHTGRLLPRYDLRNPTCFVGRKFIQENFVWNWSHAGYASDWDSTHDTTRIVQPAKLINNFNQFNTTGKRWTVNE